MIDHLQNLKLPDEIKTKLNNTELEINQARKKIMESIDPLQGVEINEALLGTQ
jgi:hypothetical protein